MYQFYPRCFPQQPESHDARESNLEIKREEEEEEEKIPHKQLRNLKSDNTPRNYI